jgi:hypothetical protein
MNYLITRIQIGTGFLVPFQILVEGSYHNALVSSEGRRAVYLICHDIYVL